jgi:hypothetical protein
MCINWTFSFFFFFQQLPKDMYVARWKIIKELLGDYLEEMFDVKG